MFAGVVAHDLKRPLSVMRGFTELVYENLVERPGHDEDAGYLKRVLTATGHMGRLIDDLLTYATARDAALDPVDIDLNTLVGELVDDHVTMVRAESAGPGPQVYVGALPAVRADPALIRQLFNNLIGNAIKYTTIDRVARIDITAEPADEGWVRITVADRGIGIPQGEHEAIFTGFHRATTAYSGTGLGLAICQRVVERHGGTITAADNPGGGARFILTLPVAAHGGTARN
ncbi:HAMP domain-containing sensor histidine kinase [Planomonospora sp. ID82291]|uniref:sensor histidine kinase n=1 Tax=Planomonospora sp. ID82291 TaxID=2738136 RepID=UPI0027DCC25C|nr:HAMP domain-containing sensor histidine kinase [Planomonospora sp. ID82291]